MALRFPHANKVPIFRGGFVLLYGAASAINAVDDDGASLFLICYCHYYYIYMPTE